MSLTNFLLLIQLVRFQYKYKIPEQKYRLFYFTSIYFIVHEYLSNIANHEQSKHCEDLIQQLKFLIGESWGQDFSANKVNVLSQVYTNYKNLLITIKCYVVRISIIPY